MQKILKQKGVTIGADRKFGENKFLVGLYGMGTINQIYIIQTKHSRWSR